MSLEHERARRFRARLLVYPRREILDPEGKAISAALTRLGFESVEEVHAGKSFDVELSATDERVAYDQVEEMCRRLLANPVTEDFEIELETIE